MNHDLLRASLNKLDRAEDEPPRRAEHRPEAQQETYWVINLHISDRTGSRDTHPAVPFAFFMISRAAESLEDRSALSF